MSSGSEFQRSGHGGQTSRRDGLETGRGGAQCSGGTVCMEEVCQGWRSKIVKGFESQREEHCFMSISYPPAQSYVPP